MDTIPESLKKLVLHIFSFLLLWVTGMGQDTKRYSFTHYGNQAGLASNEVFSVLQDDAGYIWIGTTNGLQRYDGVRFKSFRHRKNETHSLPANSIFQLILDKKKRLWLQAGSRVGIFDTRKFIFQEARIETTNELFLTAEKKIVIDQEGNILLVIGNLELLTYNEKTNVFSPKNNFIPEVTSWGIGDVIQVPGTRKYIIGSHRGIAIFDRNTNQLSYPGHNVGNEKMIDHIGDLKGTVNFLFDKSGRIWFDTWDEGAPAVYSYDWNKNELILNKFRMGYLVHAYHETRGFLQQKDGTLWIKGLGIFARYLEKEKKFQGVHNAYENEQSISFARINSFWEDREGNIWTGTSNNGLYRFNPAEQFFTNIRHTNRVTGNPGDGSFMSFASLRDGGMLAGAWGDGIYRYDKDFNNVPINIKGYSEKGTPSAWSMYPSRDGNRIWVGSQPGIHIIDQAAGTVKLYNPPALKNRTVRQVAEDPFGNLWIGTQSIGVFKWDAKKGQKNFDDGLSVFPPIPTSQIIKLTIDKEGNLWICTNGNGAYLIDTRTDKVIAHFGVKEAAERRLLNDGVASVLQYDDSTMIIAAQGLHIYNTRRGQIVKTIPFPESVPGLIAGIERDQLGYVWISTTNGILRANLKNQIFILFDRNDGLANDQFIISASFKMPDGRIVFGADNQFAFFDPGQVRLNDVAPDVSITGFSLKNTPLQVDSLLKLDRVELGSQDNAIIIEFSGLNYGGSHVIRYRLDGLENDWKYADRAQQAVYSYLPPGNYTFMAYSQDSEGHPGKNITKLVIRVWPPFWKTWWFLGLVIFAITVILFFLDKLRMQKIREMESVRTRIATSLTEDMSSSLTNINISSELAKTKIDTDTRRTKEYIGQISETSNRMVQSMYDMVWSIDPKNDTMADTIDRMKSYAMEVENLWPVNITFDIDKQVDKLKLDMEHRYEMLCIYKEALSNAAKHSDGRHVKVSLRYNKPRLMMMVMDDGRGFSMDDASMLGRGISDMRRRAAAINSILYIESEINTGTVVKLEMPV